MRKQLGLGWLLLVASLISGGLSSVRAEATLTIGDPAPKLQTGKWIQGEPVAALEKGKAYIVEFWATWCGPCRQTIPHLNELHTKFKDKGLIVIGQDVWERDESLVEPFVKKMGDKMTYRVALDDKNGNERGKMAETWMAAADQNGIPAAFVVDKEGRIAWIGHPMGLKEEILNQILGGTYDLKKAAAEFQARQKQMEEQRKEMAKLNAPFMAISREMQQKKWDSAMEKVLEAEKVVPKEQASRLDMYRFNILLAKEDYPAAYQVAGRIGESQRENAQLLNSLAWQIATDKQIKQRDLPLAENMAMRAKEVTEGKDAAILDTLARVLFMQGKKDEAIRVQQEAVKQAAEGQQESLQRALDSYRKGEIPTGE
jgi:thiol-disulfide isomerase/thioredoxin